MSSQPSHLQAGPRSRQEGSLVQGQDRKQSAQMPTAAHKGKKSEGTPKGPATRIPEAAQTACYSEPGRGPSEARSSHNGPPKDPYYAKAFQVSQEACRKSWKESKDKTRPPSELHDCATLVDILRQARFQNINHILVCGLKDPSLRKVEEILRKGQSNEIMPGVLSPRQHTFFREIQVIERIRHLYKTERGVDLKITATINGLSSEFQEVLRNKIIGFQITPTGFLNEYFTFKGSTLLYDLKWFSPSPESETFTQQLGKYRLLGLPPAILTRYKNIHLDPESKDPRIRPTIRPPFEKYYHHISLISRLRHHPNEPGTEAVEPRLLARKETKLTKREYAAKGDCNNLTFALEPSMILLCLKSSETLAPAQPIDLKSLYHDEGPISPSEAGPLDRGIVYQPVKKSSEKKQVTKAV